MRKSHTSLIVVMTAVLIALSYFAVSAEVRSRNLERDLLELKSVQEDLREADSPSPFPADGQPTENFADLGLLFDLSPETPIEGEIKELDVQKKIILIWPDPFIYGDEYGEKLVEVQISDQTALSMAIADKDRAQLDKERSEYASTYLGDYREAIAEERMPDVPPPPIPFMEEKILFESLRQGQIISAFPGVTLPVGTHRFEAYRFLIYSDDLQRN